MFGLFVVVAYMTWLSYERQQDELQQMRASDDGMPEIDLYPSRK